jgi:2-polyprenyl-3-methyl-5-hydroxy-6-metoxy-1,4-benzoquinol methylase
MTCPLCSSSEQKKVLCKVTLNAGTLYDLAECPACGVIACDPLPSPVQLAEFYSAAYYDFDRYREEGKGMAFARKLTKWRKTGRLLDIGCATGFFIHGVKNNSAWEVYGTDFGESAVRFANEKLQLDVRQGNLIDIAFPAKFFDFIHINNVLEHVLKPVEMLEESRRIVKPDGRVYLSVPNGMVDSRDLIDFYNEENKPARSKNGHIFFFPARTLLSLLEHVGFEIIETRTYSIKRGLRSLGYLRRKRDWKTDYFPRAAVTVPATQEIVLPQHHSPHSRVYYHYRYIQGNLQMIRGLHNVGLDYLFIIRPSKK